MAEKKRFVKVVSDTMGFAEFASVYVDRETGVTYLFVKSGYGAGLTPLLDADGRPVITRL